METPATPTIVPQSIGIDIGDKTARAASLVNSKHMPTIIRNELSNETTPTVVSICSGVQRSIGDDNKLRSNPLNTVTNSMLLLSQPFSEIQSHNVYCQVTEIDNKTKVKLDIETGPLDLTFQQVLSMIVRDQLKNSKYNDGDTVVVAVPNHWGESEKQIVHEAVQIAGVSATKALVVSNSVACGSYLHHKKYEELNTTGTYCVVDVGHTHTNVSILQVTRVGVKVLASVASPIGARSIDLAIMKDCSDNVKGYTISEPKQKARVEASCRKTKEMLSTLEKDEVQCESLFGDFDLIHPIKRESLVEFASGLLNSLRQLGDSALEQSQIPRESIEKVEVIGGGARIPCVQACLREIWGEYSTTMDGSLSVATGAAIYGAHKEVSPDIISSVGALITKADVMRKLLDLVHSFTVDGGFVFGGSVIDAEAVDLDQNRALEKMLQERDDAFTAHQHAKNDLESAIYSIRSELLDDALAKGLNTRLDTVTNFLLGAEDWMHEDDRTTIEFRQRLEEVNQYVSTFPEIEAHRQRKREERRLKDEELVTQSRIAKENETKQPRTDQERLRFADEKKEQGNDLFKKQHYQESITRYVQALAFLGELYAADGEIKEKRDAISLSCNLNIASAAIKINMFQKAVDNSKQALQINSNSAKALFRMGQGYIGLEEYKQAKEVLTRAQAMEPGDKLIAAELKVLEQKEKGLVEKEKKMFSKMFS